MLPFYSDISLWWAMALFPAAAAAAMLVARMGAAHGVRGPIHAELRALVDMKATLQEGSDLNQVQARIHELETQLAAQRQDPHGSSASLGAVICLFLAFSLCLLAAATPIEGVVFCVVLALMWRIVCTDRVSCAVLDKDVFLLAFAGSVITLLVPAARWAQPAASLFGFMTVCSLVALLGVYFQLKRYLLKSPAQTFLGDGDTLLLFALTVFFGLDVLTIILFAAVAFIVQQALSFVSGAYRAGAPFVPAIFMGTLLTILLPRPPWWDLNTTVARFV